METFTTIVAQAFTTATSAVDWMVANPITLMGVGIGFAGAFIGLVKKAMRVGGRRR